MFSGQKEMVADTQRMKSGDDQGRCLALMYQPFLCALPCQSRDPHFDQQQSNHNPRLHLTPVIANHLKVSQFSGIHLGFHQVLLQITIAHQDAKSLIRPLNLPVFPNIIGCVESNKNHLPT